MLLSRKLKLVEELKGFFQVVLKEEYKYAKMLIQ